MAAIKFDLKSILTKNCLPGGDDPAGRGRAKPFTAYFCRDDKSLWISDAEGNLLSISDLLSGNGIVRAFPAAGCAGRDGAPAAMEPMEGRAGMVPIQLYRDQHRPYRDHKARPVNQYEAKRATPARLRK